MTDTVAVCATGTERKHRRKRGVRLRRLSKLPQRRLARSVLVNARMNNIPEHVVELSRRVIGCAITVHREYGPGLLESIYSECMVIELQRERMNVETGRRVNLTYRGRRIRHPLELDLVVEDSIIVELKAVERLHPVHQAQVITYLKLTGYPLGLLMNFNATTLKAGLKKVVHPDLYEPRNMNDTEPPEEQA